VRLLDALANGQFSFMSSLIAVAELVPARLLLCLTPASGLPRCLAVAEAVP
jgi:hypothetical protein